MFTAKTAGAPGFTLDAALYDEMKPGIRRAKVPELLHEMLSWRPIDIVGNRHPARLVEHDATAMQKASVRALGDKDIAHD